MNTLTLDKSNPDVAKAVEGCEVGKPQSFTITATPVADTDELLVATIDQITYEESDTAADEATPGTSTPPKKTPYKPRTAQAGATDMASE